MSQRKPGRQPKLPNYLHHRPSGRAFRYLYEDGSRRQIYLGEFDSAASHREWRRAVRDANVEAVGDDVEE